MRGLRGKHQRILGARPVFTDGMHAFVEIMEGRMRQPGLVEVQGIDITTEQVLDGIDVVNDAVVGALGNGENAWLSLDVFRERMRRDFFLDVLGPEFVERNRANNAVVVAGRRKKHRDRTTHDNCVQNRLMAITID